MEDALSYCICIPARNEEARLPILLSALAAQTVGGRLRVALTLNNTTDRSRERVEECRAKFHDRLDLVIDEIEFLPEFAHVGSARRRAMDAGAEIAGPGGVVITTDADAYPPSDWVSQNLREISRGLDAVGGRIDLDLRDPLTPEMAALRIVMDRYWHDVRQIEDAIDPVPWDPAPRHGDHTGASLAIRVSAYVEAGRVPIVPTAEDRELVQAILKRGGRLAHPLSIWTRVSPRVDGRAVNGMSDVMARLNEAAKMRQSVFLPHYNHWKERAEWRRVVRKRGGSSLVAELEPSLPPMPDDMDVTASVTYPESGTA